MIISKKLREKFIDYFKNLGHTEFKSDSLVPSSDPTLLFTSAGMVQFKDYFLGKKSGLKRACSVQKCLRTSDIERVGHTFRHLTFFEMLGNFSFGDYFKEEAIEWAWDFIVNNINLDENRLYITVYKEDNEAYEIWSKIVSKDKIYKLGKDTNFWKMGETGPCGPCSEILYDLGKEYGCKKDTCSPECDCDRFLEVWNLVFTQFNLQPDGKLVSLTQKNIDTGMGLERLSMVVNNLKNVYETDTFLEIKQNLSNYISQNNLYSRNGINLLNAIADHIRASTFAISEGILPSTEGRGYVVRKIIRRAVRYLKILGNSQPTLFKVIPTVVNTMKDTYPELELHREKVAVIIKSEEEKFLETLDEGLKIIDEITKNGKNYIEGDVVFKLYDTYGFPKELVDEILKEKNIKYDEKEFFEAEKKAKEIAKSSWKGIKVEDESLYLTFQKTNFVGYTDITSTSTLLGIIKNAKKVPVAQKGEKVALIFDTTPFYGESGGQIGDSGFIFKIENDNKLKIAKIENTKKIEGRILHIAIVFEQIEIGEKFLLEVEKYRRKNIMRHHTATHLLHKALKEVLGEHAVQSGSLVSDEYFRFDFIHWKSLTENEKEHIEKIVNYKILECLPVKTFYTNIQVAKQLGATALFEEKYEQEVRVVVIGGKIEFEKIIEQPYSIELCGGTHCSNTGEIGIFKILSESSVGTNLRRIEAICGEKVYQYINNLNKKFFEIAETLGTTKTEEIKPKIEKLIQQNKKLQKEIENIKINTSSQKFEEYLKEKDNINYYIKHIPQTDIKILRSLSDKEIEKRQQTPTVLILYSLIEDKKINIVIRINSKANSMGISVKNIAEKINRSLGIKCGGRNDFFQGGGTLHKKLTSNEIFELISS